MPSSSKPPPTRTRPLAAPLRASIVLAVRIQQNGNSQIRHPCRRLDGRPERITEEEQEPATGIVNRSLTSCLRSLRPAVQVIKEGSTGNGVQERS